MGDFPARPSSEDRKRINAALNDMLTWVCEELACGWEIRIVMIGGDDNGKGEAFGSGECWIELLDPDDNQASADFDTESMNVWSMVDHSRNPDDNAVSPDDD